jgi:hypothetical protein
MNILARKFIALLVAVTVIGSLAAPSANAAPISSGAPMVSKGEMDCGQSAPLPDHPMPCDQGATCIGMLGCAAQLTLPTMATMPVIGARLQPFWPQIPAPKGLARQPALPPPIA